jgi:hypothetical protein
MNNEPLRNCGNNYKPEADQAAVALMAQVNKLIAASLLAVFFLGSVYCIGEHFFHNNSQGYLEGYHRAYNDAVQDVNSYLKTGQSPERLETETKYFPNGK